MTICAIKLGNKYLHSFVPNEHYAESNRAIASDRFTGAEFNPVFSDAPKWFDLITVKGYLDMLVMYERYCEKHDNYYADYNLIFKERDKE